MDLTEEIVEGMRKPLVDELETLRPHFERYTAIQSALARLDAPSDTPLARPATVAPSRPPAAPNDGEARSVGRPRGTGQRAKEFLDLAKAAGASGVTIPEAAERIGIKQNYLYRVKNGLVKEGLVEFRDGKVFAK